MFCILDKFVKRRKNGKNCTYVKVFCNLTNRYGELLLADIKIGRVKTGKRFPISEYDGDLDKYLSQFRWFDSSGYDVTKYKGKRIFKHNLIWNTLYGDIPKNLTVDHIDRDKKNNDPSNLRLATRSQQMLNRNKLSNGKNEITGIYERKETGNFEVRFKGIYIGTFKTKKEAIIARNNAESRYNSW